MAGCRPAGRRSGDGARCGRGRAAASEADEGHVERHTRSAETCGDGARCARGRAAQKKVQRRCGRVCVCGVSRLNSAWTCCRLCRCQRNRGFHTHTRNGGVKTRAARALCPKRVILSQCLSRSQCAMSDTFTPVYVCMCGWVSQCVCGCEVMNVCGVGRGWEVVKEFLHDHNADTVHVSHSLKWNSAPPFDPP